MQWEKRVKVSTFDRSSSTSLYHNGVLLLCGTDCPPPYTDLGRQLPRTPPCMLMAPHLPLGHHLALKRSPPIEKLQISSAAVLSLSCIT